MPRRNWSAEIIISAIKALQAQGKPLNAGSIQKIDRNLAAAAQKYFGSWGEAVETAGIPYDSVRLITPRSKGSIIKEIRALAKKGPLNSNYMQIYHRNLHAAARKYFGGWGEALEAAGFKYKKIRKVTHKRWSKDALVREIKRRARAGKSIRGGRVSRTDSGFYKAVKRHFGREGWAKARILAGLEPFDPSPSQKWNEKTVVDAIKKLYDQNVPLHVANMLRSRKRKRIHGAGRKVFGSWKKAIRATGLDYSKIRKMRQMRWWTKARVIRGIKSLERRGIRLSSKAIQYSHGALFGAAVVRFGSWSQAVEAAGINYRTHNTRWSTKAWLRKMRPEEYRLTLETTHQHTLTRRSQK